MSGVQPMPENYIGFSIEVGSTLKMIALPTFAPKLRYDSNTTHLVCLPFVHCPFF